MSVIEPYTRIKLSFLARELNKIDASDVEVLLVNMILDGKLAGKIDQVNGILYMTGGISVDFEKERRRNNIEALARGLKKLTACRNIFANYEDATANVTDQRRFNLRAIQKLPDQK